MSFKTQHIKRKMKKKILFAIFILINIGFIFALYGISRRTLTSILLIRSLEVPVIYYLNILF